MFSETPRNIWQKGDECKLRLEIALFNSVYTYLVTNAVH